MIYTEEQMEVADNEAKMASIFAIVCLIAAVVITILYFTQARDHTRDMATAQKAISQLKKDLDRTESLLMGKDLICGKVKK